MTKHLYSESQILMPRLCSIAWVATAWILKLQSPAKILSPILLSLCSSLQRLNSLPSFRGLFLLCCIFFYFYSDMKKLHVVRTFNSSSKLIISYSQSDWTLISVLLQSKCKYPASTVWFSYHLRCPWCVL